VTKVDNKIAIAIKAAPSKIGIELVEPVPGTPARYPKYSLCFLTG
jgi:hypothetical protein